MIISKIIESFDYDKIFENENYPGKIPPHMFKSKIENFKKLYGDILNTSEHEDLENENTNIITIDEEDRYSICSYLSDVFSDVKPIMISDVSDISEISHISEIPEISETECIQDLSKTEIIEKQNKEIKELKKIAYSKKSQNLTNFIDALNRYCPESLEKKIVIINYSKNINFPITTDDLDMLSTEDIENIYKTIENIKRYKSSFNFSTIIIRLIFVLVERILVDVLKFDNFKNISQDITEEFIDLKCKTTKDFINSNVIVPSYPFIDIGIQICSKIIQKQIGISDLF